MRRLRGEVIRLADWRDRRRARSGHGQDAVVFHFDLACPFSYLAAEQVERTLPHVRWQPTRAPRLAEPDPWAPGPRAAIARRAAERRARELRLPLVWPEEAPARGAAAMRAALWACELGRGAQFALAAGRLAFCGGFEPDELEVLVEAAAAAGVGFDVCVRAAGDPRLDAPLAAAARPLATAALVSPPAVRVGGRIYAGEPGIAAAAAHARATSHAGTLGE